MIKTSTYYTKLIIDLTNVESRDEDTKSFEIEVYKGTDTINEGITYFDNFVINAKKNGFSFMPSENSLVITNAEIGVYYYFKIRHNTSVESSSWSELVSERAGDNENSLSFDANNKIVTNEDKYIEVRQKITTIPNDIDRFEIAVVTSTFTDIFDNLPGTVPSNPSSNVKPYKTIKFEDVEKDNVIFRIEDISELIWYFFYIRTVDTSGNIAANSGTNNWHYIGFGRVKIPSLVGVLVDGDFEDVYYDTQISEIATTHWEDGDQWGLRAVEELQAIDTGEMYYPKTGKYMALSNAGAIFFNRRHLILNPSDSYTFSFYASYGHSASTNVMINNHAWKVELKQYDENLTFISTKTLLASETIKTKLTAQASWKKVGLNIEDLATNCKYALLNIYTQCADIAFDSMELKKGITSVKSFVDGATYETHTQVFKDGLLTKWTVV